MKAKVVFVKDSDTVTAVFPNETWDTDGNLICYQHIGQHGPCSREWFEEQIPASPDEYAELKAELEDFGYELEVI